MARRPNYGFEKRQKELKREEKRSEKEERFFPAVLETLARAGHILVGIAWIGLLYFFNFVQVPAYAQLSAVGRALLKSSPRPGIPWSWRACPSLHR